jgi:hypothetical protein
VSRCQLATDDVVDVKGLSTIGLVSSKVSQFINANLKKHMVVVITYGISFEIYFQSKENLIS